jgi:hypothetical protein
MILPATTTQFKGVIGGTFDTVITLFQGESTYNYRGFWRSTFAYAEFSVVVGSDNNAYVAIVASTGNNPVTDSGVHWTQLDALDLTGWTGVFQIGDPLAIPSAAVPVAIDDSTGAISVNVPATKMVGFPAGQTPFYLQLTDPSSDVYYPIIGQITLINPI